MTIVISGQWSNLHPRARLALLCLGFASLRVSQFKLTEAGQEAASLALWLHPAIAILKLNFRSVLVLFKGYR
jgi:hypothetical protein